MKVLFAVNNESISESIVKKYQKEYKEIITYKNVYYFNAILKEIQKDKYYDRIVISEDLEPFANNNYDAIDKFLFEKLDSISDEATDDDGTDTPIILIGTDRRAKGDSMLIKLFGIGIYNAIIGQDRSIDEVCKLIYKPRVKKEAKYYYNIDTDDVNYQAENENDVSEAEIQNILSHYKRLGKNEERYVDSFNNIASQYTDPQLKVIIRFLPLNVKAVLEANSPKYQELITFDADTYDGAQNNKAKTKIPTKTEKIEAIEKSSKGSTLGKPVVIPSAVGAAKKLFESDEDDEDINGFDLDDIEELEDVDTQIDDIEEETVEEVAPKRGRGRPKKVKTEEELRLEAEKAKMPKRGRGRPRKNPLPEEQLEEVNLFDLGETEEQPVEENVLPGFEQEQFNPRLNNDFNEQENFIPEGQLPPSYKPQGTNDEMLQPGYNKPYNNPGRSLDSILTREKKIVAFVGTSKNGTSFIVNNLAQTLSSMNVNTAILDMTENRNSYYIYTQNDENLRKITYNSLEKLRTGVTEGIKVNRYLSVYTALPGDEKKYRDAENLLASLAQNYSVVLVDCDFNTPELYFAKAQEIYLVQSMDILTIQPLTAFLRDLKAMGLLIEEKLRVIVNQEQKIKGLTPKVVVGGMAFYNDPAMSFMTELFNRETIKYYTLPFDEEARARYLEALVDCNMSLGGYPKAFIDKLKQLANVVYPLLNKQAYTPTGNNTYSGTGFSNNMNNTLSNMQNRF